MQNLFFAANDLKKSRSLFLFIEKYVCIKTLSFFLTLTNITPIIYRKIFKMSLLFCKYREIDEYSFFLHLEKLKVIFI